MLMVNSVHSAVSLELNLDKLETKRGKGYWKFNTSLLSDPEFTNSIKNNLSKWKQEFQNIDDSRFLCELIKFQIRKFF